MDWGNLFIAFIGGSLASSIVAFVANRKTKTADAYFKLSSSIDTLAGRLEEERTARRMDKLNFRKEIDALKSDYESKLRDLELRVIELEEENEKLIIKNHNLRMKYEKDE